MSHCQLPRTLTSSVTELENLEQEGNEAQVLSQP